MRFRHLFLICFVSVVWCVLDPSSPKQFIIIDTNAWSEPLRLFNYVIDQRKDDNGRKWTYEDVWKQFLDADTVDSVLNRFNVPKTKEYSRGILFTERIVDLKKNRPQVEIEVPVFVFNELTESLTSKIGPESALPEYSVKYDDFFKFMPIKTHLRNKAILKEGFDYPKKKLGATPNELKTGMTQFFTENGINGDPTTGGSHQAINELIHQLGQDVENKRRMTCKRLDHLKKLSSNVREFKKRWTDELKTVLPFSDELKAFTGETDRLTTVAEKIMQYADPVKKYTNPTEKVIDRLIKSQEEFDLFDLKIYLYAKEMGAPIMTFNTQAFQEINDPIFLDFFKEIKILQPEINFKELKDIDRALCEHVLESSIQNDFNSEKEILLNLNKVKTWRNREIDLIEFHELFTKTISKCSKSKYEEFKDKLIEKPIFQTLDMMLKVDGQWKIDQQIAFNGDTNQAITDNLNAMKFFRDEVLNKKSLEKTDFYLSKESLLTAEHRPILLRNTKIVQALKEGIENDAAPLDHFLEFLKTENKNKNDIITYAKVLSILSTFKAESINSILGENNNNPGKKPIEKCPPSGSRKKRSIEPCALNWEDIDRFNDEHNFKRDALKAKINSDEFIKYLKTVEDPLKRQQLCQFVEQIIEATEASQTKITGNLVPDVNRIVNRNKIIDHFSKVGQVSGALNTGVFAKSILADFLSGDAQGVAVNIGFVASDRALGKLAELAAVKGVAFASSGKVMIGNSFKIASPFIRRLSSGLVVYDLVEQIKALKGGDKDALINVVGDGIILGTDIIETGIGIAEVAGFVSGASAVAGPIGLAIGATVIVGTEVYFAVKHVKELEKYFHLSLEDEIIEGIKSFFHAPSAYSEELKVLREIDELNNQLIKNAMEFLKKQQHIQRMFFPSAMYDYQNDRVCISDSAHIHYEEDYIPKIRWYRRLDDPPGGKIICAPERRDDEDGVVPPAGTTYFAYSAIGIADLTPKQNPSALFNFYQTHASAYGFNDIPNIFITSGNGTYFYGGNLNDIFVVKGDTNGTPVNVYGFNGDNTLDLSEFIMDNQLDIDFVNGFCKWPCSVTFGTINRFIGRKQKADNVTVDCSTKYINTQGGMPGHQDRINIGAKENCRYNLNMKLDSYTVVQNDALLGDFTYFIGKDQGFISIIAEPPHSQEHRKLLNTTHKFFINYDLFDLKGIEPVIINKNQRQFIFYFQNSVTNTRTPVTIWLNNKNGVIFFKDMFAINLLSNGLYGMQKTNKSTQEIIDTYPAHVNRICIMLYVQNSDGTVIIGNGKTEHNIFHNDPEQDTFIVANHVNTNNVFIIDTENISKLSQITVITGDNNQMNTLDLRSVVQKIRKLHGKNCLLFHSINTESKILKIDLIEESTLATLTTITIKNFNNNCNQWQVILNNVHILLKCDEQHLEKNQNRQQILDNYIDTDHYTPLPLIFNATEIIVITPRDIEPHTEIIVKQDIGDYTITRFDDGLLITNVIPNADSTSFIRNSCSVMLKGFDERPDIFASTTLKFNDKTIVLDELRDNIEKAIEFNSWLKEFYEKHPST